MKWLTKLNEYYKDRWWFKSSYSFYYNNSYIEDLIWAFTWDIWFFIRSKVNYQKNDWLSPQDKFISYLRKKAEEWWVKFSESRARQINQFVFNHRDDNLLVNMLQWTQAAYYQLQYQTLSVVLWWTGHIASATQIAWNFAEVLSFAKVAWWEMEYASKNIKKYNLLWENTAAQWQWVDSQLAKTSPSKLQQQASVWIKNIVDSIMKKTMI